MNWIKQIQPGGLGFKAITLLAFLTIAVLSLTPIDHPSGSNDKVNHLIAYFVLAGLVDWSYPHPGQRWWWKLLIVAGYGVVIEILQGMTAYRMLSWWDALANFTGALAYFATLPLTMRFYKAQGNHILLHKEEEKHGD